MLVNIAQPVLARRNVICSICQFLQMQTLQMVSISSSVCGQPDHKIPNNLTKGSPTLVQQDSSAHHGL